MAKRAKGLLLAALLAATPGAAHAGETAAIASTKPVPVCDLVEAAAHRYSLPVSFFTRLIWQESRFKWDALSPAGAMGVAQFMPGTARDRGLEDPMAEADALYASASLLSDLRATFGNLGLAAAAYNAGPGRVARWLADQGDLPLETVDYVEIVTGRTVDGWRDRQTPDLTGEPAFSCQRIAQVAARSPTRSEGDGAAAKAWAVVLVANPARDKVLEEFAIVRSQYSRIFAAVRTSVVHRRIGGIPQSKFIVQVERDSRASASDFCSRLLRAGGNCFVLANR